MRRLPSTLAALSAFVMLMAAPAHAATCPMLADVAGDGRWQIAPLSAGKLDIRSADVASGPTSVVAVLRVASLEPDTVDLLGVSWRLGWTIDGTRYSVEARKPINPSSPYIVAFSGGSSVQLAVDAANATFTWTIPRSAIPALATPGRVFADLVALTMVLSGSADSALSTATYTDLDAGCVPAS